MKIETERDIFQMFHKYNKLVRRKLTKPLVHSCGDAYVTALGPNGEFILSCYTCSTTIVPGLDMLNNVYAVVTEHFKDEDD